MTVTSKTYRDIFNDAVKDSARRATEVAALYNKGAPEKAAYAAFRQEWEDKVETHRASLHTLLKSEEIADGLKDFRRALSEEKSEPASLKKQFSAITSKVIDYDKAIQGLDTEHTRMLQMMSNIAIAEGTMKRKPPAMIERTKQTTDKLLDRETLDSLNRVARHYHSTYAQLQDKMTAFTAAYAHRQQQAREDMTVFLEGGLSTGKPVTAPVTARFRRKPQLQS